MKEITTESLAFDSPEMSHLRSAQPHLKIIRLGILDYAKGLQEMESARERVLASGGDVFGEMLVLQHTPVVTLGNRPLVEDLKVGVEDLARQGVAFFKTDRGGSATVHEPGQIVIYPIVKLGRRGMGPKTFVNALEQAMIETAADLGVLASRDPINPGIWVGNNKLGAIGIRIQGGVSTHGLAFNVVNDLSTFQHVTPCGLKGRGVTSLIRELRIASFSEKTLQSLLARVEEALVMRLVGLLTHCC